MATRKKKTATVKLVETEQKMIPPTLKRGYMPVADVQAFLGELRTLIEKFSNEPRDIRVIEFKPGEENKS